MTKNTVRPAALALSLLIGFAVQAVAETVDPVLAVTTSTGISKLVLPAPGAGTAQPLDSRPCAGC